MRGMKSYVVGKPPKYRRCKAGCQPILSARSEQDVFKNDIRLYEKYKNITVCALIKTRDKLIIIFNKIGCSYPSDIRILNKIIDYKATV